MEWLGGCRRGLAGGSGVIVNVIEGAGTERFYGQLEGGAVSIGVLQTDKGFKAGRWHDGALVAALPDDKAQRSTLYLAFRAAMDAASLTGRSFAEADDEEARVFYATQAHLLGAQMYLQESQSGTRTTTSTPSGSVPTAATSAEAVNVAPGPAFEGQASCRFVRPRLWTAGRTEWLGGCRQGFAEGSGVIVNVVEGAEPERFYGQLDGGSPSIGVLHTAGGFMAGRWHEGALVAALPDDMAQRNLLIEAFRVAADAATATSKSFADKGDKEASSFYATQAHLLGDQMD